MCCSLLLFVGGCPKRQAPWRVVFVPAQPSAPAETDTPAKFMVITEPAPPEPPPAPPPEEPVVAKPEEHRPRHVTKTELPANNIESEQETEPQISVPSLEPRATFAEEAALRRQVQSLQDDVRQRIAKLGSAGLSEADRKTLDDARTFFAQSEDAVKEGDLQRALNLARKASLLVGTLEK
jgi:hypothetical protein